MLTDTQLLQGSQTDERGALISTIAGIKAINKITTENPKTNKQIEKPRRPTY